MCGKGILDILEVDLYIEVYLVDWFILWCVWYCGLIFLVLLIDEIDWVDDEFEVLLLEFFGEFVVIVFELGIFFVECLLIVVFMFNCSCDLYDVLWWCCFYYWIDYLGLDWVVVIVCCMVFGVIVLLIENVI